tara:strand:- start:7119 stop:7820 length:702 start_codon:yes stop_codon:yes gene_type:complete
MHPYLNIVTKAARLAGHMQAREFDRLHEESNRAAHIASVREQSQFIVVDAIQKAYRDHGIISHDLAYQTDAETVWHVEAINGFANFRRGIPHFAIVALVKENGKNEHVLIHDPMLDETFTASRGRNFQMKNHRLRINKQEAVERLLLSGNAAEKFADDVQQTGCNALMLAYAAAGRYDAFVGNGLTEIEIDATGLMIKAAGGLYSDFSGSEKFPNGEMLASNPQLFKELLKQL